MRFATPGRILFEYSALNRESWRLPFSGGDVSTRRAAFESASALFVSGVAGAQSGHRWKEPRCVSRRDLIPCGPGVVPKLAIERLARSRHQGQTF